MTLPLVEMAETERAVIEVTTTDMRMMSHVSTDVRKTRGQRSGVRGQRSGVNLCSSYSFGRKVFVCV